MYLHLRLITLKSNWAPKGIDFIKRDLFFYVRSNLYHYYHH